MSNRLAGSSSPYLRQHQDNPVDWYEWSPEAFQRAKSEDKPIFLSIGYSSCHWCHVMAHECFEDDEVAAILNEYFVCIKLDREERPDIDDVYMTAIQLISGRGGWPLSVFLTPDKKPFFAGTYFPKQDRGQHPGFMSLLKQLITAWKTQRQQVTASADQVATAVEQARSRTLSSLTSRIQPSLFKECFQSLNSSFDKELGGFGEAPKFPPHTALAFLIEYAIFDRENAGRAFEMVVRTLASMALGGIHDQVGGGFHRYSTDAEWRLPHFEKMLWDNALLLEQYVNAAAILEASNPDIADLFVRTAMGIVEFVKRSLTSTSGLFCSALDADSEGEEGTYYTWTEEEIRQRLGSTADEFITAFQIEEDGNFLDEATRKKNGRNLLLLNPEFAGRFQSELAELLAVRNERPSPGLDDKCVASANGMMIKALSLAGETMLAERCAINWIEAYQTLGELPHQISGGRPLGDAFLDDYGCMIQGLTHLAAATDKPAYAALAEDLAMQMIGRFGDSDKKGFYYTSIEAEPLMGRHKPALDQSGPSANALAIQALIQLAMLEEAREHLMAVVGWAQKAPQAAEALVHAALQLELQDLMQESATGAVVAMPPENAPKNAPLSKVTAKLETVEIRAENGVGNGCVIVTIPEELHLNTANPPARWLVPTQLTANGIKINVAYPLGEGDQYSGNLRLPFSTEKCSSSTEFELRLSFQACTDRECLAADEIVLDGVVIV